MELILKRFCFFGSSNICSTVTPTPKNPSSLLNVLYLVFRLNIIIRTWYHSQFREIRPTHFANQPLIVLTNGRLWICLIGILDYGILVVGKYVLCDVLVVTVSVCTHLLTTVPRMPCLMVSWVELENSLSWKSRLSLQKAMRRFVW